MYVPNYIPPPVEIPNNVTQERYPVRLGFIRRVAVLHLCSLVAIGLLSQVEFFKTTLPLSLIELGIVLLFLSLVRIATRATKLDQILSLATFPVLAIMLATVIRCLATEGLSVWGVIVGAACSAIYALLCGRDFSFVGQFMLSLIVSSVVLAIAATTIGLSGAR